MDIKMIDKIDDAFMTVNRGHIYTSVINKIEKALIESALECSAGNRLAAAKILGIHRNTLRLKLKKLHIDAGRFKQ